MRYGGLLCVGALMLALAGCGDVTAKRVPNVAGDRLDVAKERLDDAGLGYEVIGGGAFGVVVESRWQVCEQSPRPGRRAKSVDLVVARSCPAESRPGEVPAVEGLRLDVAERVLGDRGLEYYVYPDGKVLISANWTVCDQYPAPGDPAAEVELYVEHFSCEDDD